jgi:GH35 family endo-1,4-beta-xylanase
MRCTDSKDESSMGRCTFEHNMPWTGKWIPSILNKTYSIQSDWQWFYIPYKSNKESKQVCLSLKVGVTKPQTLQIAQAFWYKFSKSTDINTLPNTKITYPGREENAQWRQDAFKRIEKIRKDDYTLTISNKGKPLQNVKVNIKLKHHKFGFALAISPKYFNEGYESKLEEILYSFNSIVIPNDFKWPFYKYKHCQIFIAKALEWSRQNDMINRGHCMVWGAWKHMPPHIEKLKNTPEKLKEAVLAHIKEMSIGTPPIVNQWDVINEPFTEKDLIKIFGDDIMVEMLKTVKEYNPNFKSYINDYGVISGTHKLHQDGLFNILKKLQEKNTPYDGIGFQAYYGSFPIAPTEILKRLDRFSVFGKEMYVTEYNMDQEDQDLFADYTRDLLILSFSYPAMTGFASWVEMWLPDGSPTKALKNWTQLIKETWDTDLIATTDNNGKIKFRGFRGSYNISFEIKKEKYKYFRDYSNTNINEIDIYDPFKTIK